jgi:excisionase family DNA binding protein
MSQDFLTIEHVADLLGLHVKTVRAYVRDGRLKATRIGKSYRVMRGDLEALAGGPVRAHSTRHIDVSSVVHIDAVDQNTAYRLTAFLTSAVNEPQDDGPVRIDTAYDETRARLRIVISGGAETTALLLRAIDGIAGKP